MNPEPLISTRGSLPTLLAAALILSISACRSIDLDTGRSSSTTRSEPRHGRRYELYRPAAYDRATEWPLVVVCAGGWFDSPAAQRDAWQSLAESKGFLVIAPRLRRLPGGIKPDPAERSAALRANEAQILAAVTHVRAGHTVSDDRIFLYGWSDGAPSALFTGLRHPELFRAVSVAEPAFEEGMIDDVRGRIDSYQPVQLRYALGDALTGKHGHSCEAWLRANGVDVRAVKGGSPKRNEVAPVVEFFEQVILNEPFLRIEATPEAGGPLSRRFELRGAGPAARYFWEFGDGDASAVARPMHVYPAPGTYRVRVLLDLDGTTRVERMANVTVP